MTSGGDRYAIPQVNLLELVRARGRRRGSADRADPRRAGLPAARQPAAARLPGEGARAGGRRGRAAESANIVVLQADDRQFGLVVDGVSDTEEIVVKPLGQHLKGIPTFAGATIMGDGRVALILDVHGARPARPRDRETRERGARRGGSRAGGARARRRPSWSSARTTTDAWRFRCRWSTGWRSSGRSAIERSGPHPVVQYRDEILPLLEVESLLEERQAEAAHVAEPRDGARDGARHRPLGRAGPARARRRRDRRHRRAAHGPAGRDPQRGARHDGDPRPRDRGPRPGQRPATGSRAGGSAS